MDAKLEKMHFFGVLREACSIIFSWRKIFSQITLILVLPLCFIFFLDAQVSLTLSKLTASYYWLYKAAHFTFRLIFSLLLTSAVAYTIACIRGGSEASFKKIATSIIPKVWKRLMITTSCTILAMILYLVVAFSFLHPLALFLSSSGRFAVSTIRAVLTIFLMLGLVYLNVVWQLAGVISVLEDAQGIEAMNKSMELTKGKIWMAFLIFSSIFVSSFLLQLAIKKLFALGLGLFGMVSYGVTCLLLLLTLILVSHATQTVFYFVCKSDHREINVDEESFLSNDYHAVVYVEEKHVPLLKPSN